MCIYIWMIYIYNRGRGRAIGYLLVFALNPNAVIRAFHLTHSSNLAVSQRWHRNSVLVQQVLGKSVQRVT